MNNILSEKEYQKFLLERLEQDNGYLIRKSSNYDEGNNKYQKDK